MSITGLSFVDNSTLALSNADVFGNTAGEVFWQYGCCPTGCAL